MARILDGQTNIRSVGLFLRKIKLVGNFLRHEICQIIFMLDVGCVVLQQEIWIENVEICLLERYRAQGSSSATCAFQRLNFSMKMNRLAFFSKASNHLLYTLQRWLDCVPRCHTRQWSFCHQRISDSFFRFPGPFFLIPWHSILLKRKMNALNSGHVFNILERHTESQTRPTDTQIYLDIFFLCTILVFSESSEVKW